MRVGLPAKNTITSMWHGDKPGFILMALFKINNLLIWFVCFKIQWKIYAYFYSILCAFLPWTKYKQLDNLFQITPKAKDQPTTIAERTMRTISWIPSGCSRRLNGSNRCFVMDCFGILYGFSGPRTELSFSFKIYIFHYKGISWSIGMRSRARVV